MALSNHPNEDLGHLVKSKWEKGKLNPEFEKYGRFEPEISVHLLVSMELKLRMVEEDYVFKKVDGVDIEATVHWKAPRTEAAL